MNVGDTFRRAAVIVAVILFLLIVFLILANESAECEHKGGDYNYQVMTKRWKCENEDS